MIGQEGKKEVKENGLGIDFTNDSFVRKYCPVVILFVARIIMFPYIIPVKGRPSSPQISKAVLCC